MQLARVRAWQSGFMLRAPQQIGLVRLLVPGLLAALVATEWLILLGRSFTTGMGQDFTTFYVSALAWLHGQDPYTSGVPVQLAAALHVRYQDDLELPILLPLFAPLTVLSPHVAFILYVFVQDALIAAGTLVLALTLNMRRPRLLTLAVVASPSTFLIGYFGQVAAFVYVASALAWWARYRGYNVSLGLCVAIACIKPQLGLCTALPLLWGCSPATREGQRVWLGLLAGGVLLMVGTLCVEGVAGTVTYIKILHAFGGSNGVHGNVDGLGLSSLYQGWLSPSLSSAIAPLATVALGIAVMGVVMRGRARPSPFAVAILTILLTLLLPYSHQYDSIILLPALIVGARQVLRGRLARTLRFVAVALVVVTPLTALSVVPIPFRLLPLGLVLYVARPSITALFSSLSTRLTPVA